MPDRISRGRSVRLVIHLPHDAAHHSMWALVLETVRGGVPHASLEARGVGADCGPTPGVGEIWELIHDIAGCPYAPPLEAAELDEVPGAPGGATGADPDQLLLPGTDPL